MTATTTGITPQPSITLHQPEGEFSGRRVMVVDDEETIRLALSRFLRSRDYIVDTADSGHTALAKLDGRSFELLLCDVRMPGMGGLDLVPLALENDPDLAIIMLTAVNDAPTASGVLSNGAFDYLVKPMELSSIQEAVERALRKRDRLIQQRLSDRRLRQQAELVEAVGREEATMRELTITIAETLVNAMEAKDVYLRGHSQRVAELAASVANALGLDDERIEAVRLAGKLHDVGMIGIRESVLHKPGALTPDEYQHVKEHVRIGMEILFPLKHLALVLEYIQDHHERVDGTGYPRGVGADAISIGGRILAAADAYDSLTSKRAYREASSPAETVELLRAKVGTLLDEEVYHALCRVVKNRKTLVFIDGADEPG